MDLVDLTCFATDHVKCENYAAIYTDWKFKIYLIITFFLKCWIKQSLSLDQY